MINEMKKLYPLLSVLFFIYWGCESYPEEIKYDPTTEVLLDGVVYSIKDTDTLILNIAQFTELPSDVWKLTNLTYLDLSRNQLSGTIPPEIGNLTNLTYLNLGFNQITGSIPPEIGNLINLTYLGLYLNQLTGSIPPEIGNLTNLTWLDLGNNGLTGSSPPEIGNLTNLEQLSLEGNQLTGSIPTEIGNLTHLQELWLSNNQLTGEIPESICELNIDWSSSDVLGNSDFEISNNQLCPPYPSCVEDYVGEQDTSDCP
tara:strand:- start:21 stop:791 length:771 start_codon:yes stop_codon:yes gene_type:complete